MRRVLVLVALLALVTTACFKADVAIKVKADGSGEIHTIEAIDRSALRQLGNGVASGADLVPPPEDVPPGVEAKAYASGSYEGVEVSTSFTGVEELSERLADVDITLDAAAQSATGGTTEGALSGLQIEPNVGGWSFRGNSFMNTALSRQWANASQQIQVRLAVTLPGHAVASAHNADRVESGHTFVWNLSPGDSRRQIYASTVQGPQGSSSARGVLAWLLVGLLVLAGGAATGLGLSQRRRRPSIDRADPATAGPPQGDATQAGAAGGGADGRPWAAPAAPTGPSGWPVRPPTGAPIAPANLSRQAGGTSSRPAATPRGPVPPQPTGPAGPRTPAEAARPQADWPRQAPAVPPEAPPGSTLYRPPQPNQPAAHPSPPATSPSWTNPSWTNPSWTKPSPPIPFPPTPPTLPTPGTSAGSSTSGQPGRVPGRAAVPAAPPPAWGDWERPLLDVPPPEASSAWPYRVDLDNGSGRPRPWFVDDGAERETGRPQPTTAPSTSGEERPASSPEERGDRPRAFGFPPHRPNDLPDDPSTQRST